MSWQPSRPKLFFDDEVLQIRQRYARVDPPANPVLFYGSSSMRMWRSLPTDFPDLPLVNHAFGGSTLGWCIHYLPALVYPFNPKALVLYAGDNDLGNGLSPEKVRHELSFLVGCVRNKLGEDLQITFMSIKPSPAREYLRPQIRRANHLCWELCRQQKNMGYIDIHHAMLNQQNKPRRELYAPDLLHLSDAGYRLWARLLRPRATEHLIDEVGEKGAEARRQQAEARALAATVRQPVAALPAPSDLNRPHEPVPHQGTQTDWQTNEADSAYASSICTPEQGAR